LKHIEEASYFYYEYVLWLTASYLLPVDSFDFTTYKMSIVRSCLSGLLLQAKVNFAAAD